jgi:iron complex outermembrane receptor protein
MKGLVTLASLVLCTLLVHAQKSITGKVTDSKSGASVSGATIKVKGGKATSTNNEGLFKLQAASGAELEITSIGYEPLSVTANKDFLEITLSPASTELKEMVFVGARGAARSKVESPVPIDVINANQAGISSGKPDLSSQLNMVVPSFNYNKVSGGDGSDAMDLAALRGLGYDQTLVLINGKRRHMTAFVNQAGTRGRGNSGTDLNAIPEAMIDRVEILRDGASAQYGSDAIAGVINIVLKKDVNKLHLTTGWSGFYDHKYNTLQGVDPSQYYTGSKVDGNSATIGLSYGLPLGQHGGLITFGGNFLAQGKTFRAPNDTNWTTNPKALGIQTRRAFGDGSVVSGGGMFNMELPIGGTKTTFYSFGGYNYKHSNVYAWTRKFSSDPQKYPTNPDGSLIFVPGIMRTYGVQGGSLSADNVYYNPQEDVYIKDLSLAVGFKGSLGAGWDWDLSNVIGRNDFHFFGNKTFNASLPSEEAATTNRFDDGGFNFLQNTSNLDLTRRFDGVAQGMTLSFGGEFRYERYSIYKGEYNSYGFIDTAARYFPNVDATRYLASGSEGYPGYQPTDAVVAHRTNEAAYADASIDITKRWLVDGAARYEHYSDFGSVGTFKFATRYKLTDNFNIRGSVSTGFRAPSLQQINFSNTNTTITAGQLIYTKLIPNYSNIARQAGIPKLKQEESTNYSLGFTWQPVHNLTITADGYLIKTRNRIIFTGNFDGSVASIAPYLGPDYNNGITLNAVQFFANAVNTTNKGIDLVVDYNLKWGKEGLKLMFSGNIQSIHIDKVNIPPALNTSYLNQQRFYSSQEQAFLIASAPKNKANFLVEYSVGRVGIGSRLTWFGKLTTLGAGSASLPGATPGGPGSDGISNSGNGWDPYVQTDDGKSVVPEAYVYHGKATTDVYVTVKLSRTTTLFAGVDNIFNVHPDFAVTKGARYNSYNDSQTGGAWDSVQMGFDGMRMFTKLAFNF